MDTLFKSSRNFASLSLKDLIEARDLFHYHLLNKKNVVATALGLYRIRIHDPWPSEGDPDPQPARTHTRRTLTNSQVRPYSWPCVYVFVSSWEEEHTLANANPSDVVPKTLYLPDGRSVPVCVIEARKQDFAKDLMVRADSRVPRNLLGPGTPIVNRDAQGMERVGTAGCVVRDGESYYLLTNRHVVGAPGTPISALQGNREPEIGIAAHKSLTRKDFKTVYPHFQSTEQHLLMDVGLVAVDDILAWKTEVPGIAPIGPVVDLYDNSLSLNLITMKVVGQSAISGLIRGEIHGLFYRYKALGGAEYVSDFLIGPESQEALRPDNKRRRVHQPQPDRTFAIHHGDSGTVLYIEHKETGKPGSSDEGKTTYYPFAMLWGKEEFLEGGKVQSHPYALATALSTALNILDLDYVRDVNLDQEYIWGWVGHYAIGRALSLPVDRLKSNKLRDFIGKNIDLLAIQPDKALDNDPKVLTKGSDTVHFVPLADVPDNVWKGNVNFSLVDQGEGEKKKHKAGPGSRGSADNKNHFADIDIVYKEQKTFLQLNFDDPDTYLNPPAWLQYFKTVEPKFAHWQELLERSKNKAEPADGSAHWGALPFRIKQIFDIMVAAAKKGNAKLFLCAGGVLIHYLGDACQPLHTSFMSNGDPNDVVKRSKSEGNRMRAEGVHVGYEDDMIAYGYTQKDLATALKKRIAELANKEDMPEIANGYDAAKAAITLVHATQADIAPKTIVSEWVSLLDVQKKTRAASMWTKFGDKTTTCMARGTRLLAVIWQAAWDAGNGDKTIGEGPTITEKEMMNLYNDPKVIPSVALNQYPADVHQDWSGIVKPDPQGSPASHSRGRAASTSRGQSSARRAPVKKAKKTRVGRKKKKT
ncbi:hypothetical protein [Rhodoplanes sp. Z2-YC6860]|uniref:hypothetical protein n=1 Tax=Rhodoplanes sp. Z2-YC6860 TaxID=674703 RepID=UPI00078C7456|nr:hypothetical protein [Rhodoplanes sp. Z2-YC6860]AMN40936.1 hypothetical protein RHPLAN_24980 [Rhodoplanes sp. Z2-YC6860]